MATKRFSLEITWTKSVSKTHYTVQCMLHLLKETGAVLEFYHHLIPILSTSKITLTHFVHHHSYNDV